MRGIGSSAQDSGRNWLERLLVALRKGEMASVGTEDSPLQERSIGFCWIS